MCFNPRPHLVSATGQFLAEGYVAWLDDVRMMVMMAKPAEQN